MPEVSRNEVWRTTGQRKRKNQEAKFRTNEVRFATKRTSEQCEDCYKMNRRGTSLVNLYAKRSVAEPVCVAETETMTGEAEGVSSSSERNFKKRISRIEIRKKKTENSFGQTVYE